MTNKQALQVVTAASLEFRGTRKDHEAIAQALDVIGKLVPDEAVAPALAQNPTSNVVDINS
jgi:hypothetical protein